MNVIKVPVTVLFLIPISYVTIFVSALGTKIFPNLYRLVSNQFLHVMYLFYKRKVSFYRRKILQYSTGIIVL
jgi:hypothetical protein